MSVCIRCSIDKPDRDYRHKTSGPRTGFRFPTCIACQEEQINGRAAAELRAKGYAVEATDPDVKTREESGAARLVESVTR